VSQILVGNDNSKFRQETEKELKNMSIGRASEQSLKKISTKKQKSGSNKKLSTWDDKLQMTALP
jgi:hypothetical protein